MDKYKIKISTSQTLDEDGKEERIELITNGSVEKSGDSFIIDYDESELTQMEGCRTRLKIAPDNMIMTKLGVVSSKMEFRIGCKYSNEYITPYGIFDVEFDTVRYVNNLNSDGTGTVEVDYKIILSNTTEGFNKLRIKII